MSISTIFESLLHKGFSDEEVTKYVGTYNEAYLTHANSEKTRANAASGGVVSALLIDALENGSVDGLLVCKTIVIDTKVRARFFIACSKNEILEAQGSTYVATKFSAEAIPLMQKFDGKLGVVGLPCDITMLQNKQHHDEELDAKIVFTVALACGHNSQKKLIDHVTTKLEKQANSKLTNYRFRRGHWRGELVADFENDVKIKKPFSHFSLYQNLFFFAEKKCLFCHDHFGYNADISIGDVWSYKLKNTPIKHSGIIAKTHNGSKILNTSIKREALTVKDFEVSEIVEGQKRIAPFHYNISSRHFAGKKFGLNIPDKVNEKVKWHEYLAAYIVLFNWKWSQNKRYSHLIFKIPRPIMKMYLYLLKGLESLK